MRKGPDQGGGATDGRPTPRPASPLKNRIWQKKNRDFKMTPPAPFLGTLAAPLPLPLSPPAPSRALPRTAQPTASLTGRRCHGGRAAGGTSGGQRAGGAPDPHQLLQSTRQFGRGRRGGRAAGRATGRAGGARTTAPRQSEAPPVPARRRSTDRRLSPSNRQMNWKNKKRKEGERRAKCLGVGWARVMWVGVVEKRGNVAGAIRSNKGEL